MKLILSITLTIALSLNTKAQTFIKQGENPNNAEIILKYDENKGGNRPSLSIVYKDGFSMFNHVMPVCGGEYGWCLRNDENEDIGYIKIDLSANKLIAKTRTNNLLARERNYTQIKKHIDQIEGIYLKVR